MQQPLELILTRQWASHMAYPIWVMNEKGDLIYFNEHAEKLLGLRYDVSGSIVAKDLTKTFEYTDEAGAAIAGKSLPINIALTESHPAHRKMKLKSLDGVSKWIESTAFPIIGQGGKKLGALSIFWEINDL